MLAAYAVLGILGGLALGGRFLLWVVCYTIVHGHLPMRRWRAMLRALRQAHRGGSHARSRPLHVHRR